MLHALGIPTWFMTLSAADLHWTEMIEAVSIHKHKPLTRKQICNMSIKERSETLKANPVTSVTMFQYRVESFFTHYILDKANPVGKVKEYAIKIEFQERGSPHAHCLLWVDGAPHIDVDTDEDVCSFIDTYVSGIIPNDSIESKHMAKLVKQYQIHSHSSYCRRNHSCHFGFHKAPSPCTIICREPENNEDRDSTLKNACDVLAKVYEVIDGTSDETTLTDILEHVHVSEETYIAALKVTNRGRSVIHLIYTPMVVIMTFFICGVQILTSNDEYLMNTVQLCMFAHT